MTLPKELLRLLKRSKGITHVSKEVREGFIFFAIRGKVYDGHDFVSEAVERGAIAVVVERDVGSLPVDKIVVGDTREALALSAHLFFGKPSERLKVIGVTGTNGKTTTTYILERILSSAGEKVGLIGTIDYRVGDRVLGKGRTTPDPVVWHRTLSDMAGLGAAYAVAEVSSHALDQKRVWGTTFDAVLFTNLTQDHLDYHRDMEDYFRAKRRLFVDYPHRKAIVNADDPYGRRLIKELGGNVITYGKEGNVRIRSFRTGFDGSVLEIEFEGRRFTFETNLVGGFQAYNLSAGVSYALSEGIEIDLVREALRKIHVPGRFEVYTSQRGFIVVIDYAHTPDAVDNVLRTIRDLARRRVITVFGAGGDRDRAKRPLMGEAAQRWSDLIILTSDNPRSEDPMKIIGDIMEGVKDRSTVIVIPDRREAIEEAIRRAGEGDVVAILGKGHEEYQEIRGVKYPFSDARLVKELIGYNDQKPSGGEDVLRL